MREKVKEEDEEEEEFNSIKLISNKDINEKNSEMFDSKEICNNSKSNVQNKHIMFKKNEQTINSTPNNKIINTTGKDCQLDDKKVQELNVSGLKLYNAVLKNSEEKDNQFIYENRNLLKFSLEKSKNENIDYLDKNSFVVEQSCIFCFKTLLCSAMGMCKKCVNFNDDVTDDYLNEPNKVNIKGISNENKQDSVGFKRLKMDSKKTFSKDDSFNRYDEGYKQEEKLNDKIGIGKEDNTKISKNNAGDINYKINDNDCKKKFDINANINITNDLSTINDNLKNPDIKKDMSNIIKQENLKSFKMNVINIKTINKNGDLQGTNNTNKKELNLSNSPKSVTISKINENLVLKNISSNPCESNLIKIKLDGLNTQNLTLTRDQLSRSSDYLIKNSMNSSISSNNLHKPIKVIKANFSKENPGRLSNREMRITNNNEFKIPSANIDINPKIFVTKNVEIKPNSYKKTIATNIVIPKIPTIKRTNTRNNKTMNKNTQSNCS